MKMGRLLFMLNLVIARTWAQEKQQAKTQEEDKDIIA